MTSGADHRTGPRRRGSELEDAILTAALDELTEVGLAELRMERVALRAQASKASLYRRWPSRLELAMAAVRHAFPDLDAAADTGSLRGDLLGLLRGVADQLAGPAGQALAAVLSESLLDPARAGRAGAPPGGTTLRALRLVADRAVSRGEIDPARVTDRRLEAGSALLRHHFITHGAPVPDEIVVAIVDEVALPLLTGDGLWSSRRPAPEEYARSSSPSRRHDEVSRHARCPHPSS
ncbi:transcriptional regulator, TetR family [Serinicoccus hydrothermalis]|uniref:Transcriptional regulator, TetR family n=1 Tax=Serinicoccus hydrothermalis TaxID=1758689 RepID=A0A1B1NFD2_9MICO|nr:TetR/AcrR family transcriptional regulator [Serinicoccus hydrothermalis]ANS80144.1 transcriptional regulator, TetR family [Serinicoccus hydrothermalis]